MRSETFITSQRGSRGRTRAAGETNSKTWKHKETADIHYDEIITHCPEKKTIHVPFIDYIDTEVERIDEVGIPKESVCIITEPVDQYVDKIVKNEKVVHKVIDVERRVPKFVEYCTTMKFVLPAVRPTFETYEVPISIPRFIEVPVAVDVLHPAVAKRAEMSAKVINEIDGEETRSLSLCNVENAAAYVKGTDMEDNINTEENSYAQAIYHNYVWNALAAKLTSRTGDGCNDVTQRSDVEVRLKEKDFIKPAVEPDASLSWTDTTDVHIQQPYASFADTTTTTTDNGILHPYASFGVNESSGYANS